MLEFLAFVSLSRFVLIETPQGTLEMTKAQFCVAFQNMVESALYREHRGYSYSTMPRKPFHFSLPRKVDPRASS
jgi:hypothetical protein